MDVRKRFGDLLNILNRQRRCLYDMLQGQGPVQGHRVRDALCSYSEARGQL